jgi:hypothetical protein
MRLKASSSCQRKRCSSPTPTRNSESPGSEYYDHYDTGQHLRPCSGESCPFCAANDNPSTRALTAWYFPEAGDAKDQLKIFTMNFSTINELSDEAEEEDGVLGKKVRIRRMDDRGNYRFASCLRSP